jgi:hypothetical protein
MGLKLKRRRLSRRIAGRGGIVLPFLLYNRGGWRGAGM